MEHSKVILFAVIAVILLGAGSQWVAWLLRLPSILVLLAVGFLAGVANRGEWFAGEIDLQNVGPFVSIAVAMILYEGGLTLRFKELKGSAAIVSRLVTLGAAVTWLTAAGAAAIFLELSDDHAEHLRYALLLGAILTVTGPTVVGPMLRHIRPSGPVGPILKWEGIVIDPIGAMLAVLVYEVVVQPGSGGSLELGHAVVAVVKTVVVGGGLGVAGGLLLAVLLRRHWIPDFLDNPVSVMLVLLVYGISEKVQTESGLLTATVMGIVLANQSITDVRHIVEFKENLRTLLISSLFIVLAARVEGGNLTRVGWGAAGFVLALVCVARPLSVLAATAWTSLSLRERLFLCWVAPRGIVAAAVASVLGDESMVALTFIVIVATVVLYGLTGPLVARRLGVADPDPQGLLIVGASAWSRAVATALARHGFRTLMVDSNRQQMSAARLEGIETHSDSILAEHVLDDLELGGLGRVVAATPNDWVNALASQRFERVFGRGEVYQLWPVDPDSDAHRHLHGRWLFSRGITWGELARRVSAGAVVKSTPITEEFTWESFCEHYGDRAVPMFVITDAGKLIVVTEDQPIEPTPGQTLVSLVAGESG